MRQGSRVLAQLAAGQPAAEADLKTLEAKISDKVEVTREAGGRRGERLPEGAGRDCQGGCGAAC